MRKKTFLKTSLQVSIEATLVWSSAHCMSDWMVFNVELLGHLKPNFIKPLSKDMNVRSYYFLLFPFCNIVFSFCNLLPPSIPSGIQLFAPQTLRSKRSRVNTQLRFGIKILNIHFFLTICCKNLQTANVFYFFTARFGLGANVWKQEDLQEEVVLLHAS